MNFEGLGVRIPRVPARKYQEANRAASILWKVKGNKDGDVYQGQVLISPCKSCPDRGISGLNFGSSPIDRPSESPEDDPSPNPT